MKLIDKDALVAWALEELKLAEKFYKETKSDVYFGKINLLKKQLSFLDTLEVKVVDLCKEEEKIWKDFNIGECHLSKNDLEKISKHFYSLGLKVAQKGENNG